MGMFTRYSSIRLTHVSGAITGPGAAELEVWQRGRQARPAPELSARRPWPTAPKPSHTETCGHVSSERAKGSGSRGRWGLSHRAISDGSSKEKTSDLRVLSRRSLARPRAGGTEVRGKDTAPHSAV